MQRLSGSAVLFIKNSCKTRPRGEGLNIFFRNKILILAIFLICSTSLSAEDIKSSEEKFLSLLELQQIKIPPEPIDWMAMHPEPGQSFAQYIKSNPLKPDNIRKYIYISLLGDFDTKQNEIIQQTAQYMENYFGLPVKFADPISLAHFPDSAKRINPLTKDNQILTTYVLEEVLMSKKPKDAFSYIAFTTSDLWPGEGWNFVFGQASIEDGVGVWSIYRNGDPNKSEEDFKLCRLRTIKTGTHEIGHMFSMHHCIYFECNMNGSNHRLESDRRPLWLCPICLMKLTENTGQDPRERYKHLLNNSRTLGMENEQKFFERSIEQLGKKFQGNASSGVKTKVIELN